MTIRLFAAGAATLCLAQIAVAQDKPDHDRTIEKAAIAILQTKLPEFRRGLDIDKTPAVNVEPDRRTDHRRISVQIENGRKPVPQGRIIWR